MVSGGRKIRSVAELPEDLVIEYLESVYRDIIDDAQFWRFFGHRPMSFDNFINVFRCGKHAEFIMQSGYFGGEFKGGRRIYRFPDKCVHCMRECAVLDTMTPLDHQKMGEILDILFGPSGE